jgi:hypothetical protein
MTQAVTGYTAATRATHPFAAPIRRAKAEPSGANLIGGRTRHDLTNEARVLQQGLGAVWVREFGSPKYGKPTMAGLTDAELLAVYTAAVAAPAQI